MKPFLKKKTSLEAGIKGMHTAQNEDVWHMETSPHGPQFKTTQEVISKFPFMFLVPDSTG